jgi:hypothetical protein
VPEKTIKMKCTIGSLAGRDPSVFWSEGEIFETSEELAEIFEKAGHAVRIGEPVKGEGKKGGK